MEVVVWKCRIEFRQGGVAEVHTVPGMIYDERVQVSARVKEKVYNTEVRAAVSYGWKWWYWQGEAGCGAEGGRIENAASFVGSDVIDRIRKE